jgi:membrane-bound metal-dependent hydrolase YbcI (DUF457 family)
VLFFGHVGASILLAGATDTDPLAAIAGSLTPDVIDKTGSIVLHLMPRRWLAHGLPFFVLACLATKPVLSRRRWRGYALGYAGHLLCDLWCGGKVPWFAPFEPMRYRRRHRTLRQLLVYLLPEVGGIVLTARSLSSSRRRRDESPG